MKRAAAEGIPELSPLYERSEYAEGMRAFSAAAEPRAGLEARVLARLEAERGKPRLVIMRPARAWSLAAAATLLACAFFGERAFEHHAAVERTTQRANAPSVATRPFSAAAGTPAIKTADAQRAPVTPLAVGNRLGRATRVYHPPQAKGTALRQP